MSAREWLQWHTYHAKRLQREELEMLKAEAKAGRR